MRDEDTMVYAARSHPTLKDDRVIVSLKDEGSEILLFFDDLSGEGPIREVRLLPALKTKPFEPWRLVQKMPHYLSYSRATITARREDAGAWLRTIRKANASRRGVDEQFLREFAAVYNALVAEGERYPSTVLAQMHGFDKAQVSRWRKAARELGLIKEDSP